MSRRTLTVAEVVADVQSRVNDLQFEIHGDPTTRLVDVTHDSERVSTEAMYCCVKGATRDGHDFASVAVQAGATVLLVERLLPLDVTQVLTTNVRRAMGFVAAAVHGWPSDHLTMVGVTGTNGKTTTTNLIATVLRGEGTSTAVIGTIGGTRTTPESTDLQRRLAELRDSGTQAVVMEVTSHALALDRVAGTRFDVSVFTNLFRDHLDFHGTQEQYFAAKAKLFEPGLSKRAVVNRDDVHGKLLIDAAAIECTSFGASDVSDVVVTPRHHEFTWKGSRVRVPLGGRFNVMNSLAAATTSSVLGVQTSAIASHLVDAAVVPGRFQVVDSGLRPTVIVDYAHDADSLSIVISATRELVAGGSRVIVVFGCGGDRDKGKRPEMGRVASELADVTYVTSDNPRSESPASIAADILAGVASERASRVSVELDRRAAIERAISEAKADDVVIIAGKGHETTQTIGDESLPFDDVLVARSALERVA